MIAIPASDDQWVWRRRRKVAWYGAGLAIIASALAVFLTDLPPTALLGALEELFSISFLSGYFVLTITSLYAGWRVGAGARSRYWHELGLQSAAGVATLALTFTLLGISLGIGSLADQDITPDSIQHIVRGLTGHFATAFMTTVLGLPTANALRAWCALRMVRTRDHY